MECAPCGKTFTGQVCYDQHLQSEKHKRKVLSSGLLNNETRASPNSDDRITVSELKYKVIRCDVCDIIFNSLESFQSHSVTQEHAEKIILKNKESSLNHVSSSCGSYSDQNLLDIGVENKSLEKNEMILPELNDQKRSQFLSFSTCEVCKKNFSGPEPYRQHMESAPHKRNVQLQTNPHYAGADKNSSTFTCEPCKKTFTGQVPYVQHMTSEAHKKKLQNLQAFEKFASQSDFSSKMPDLNLEDNACQVDSTTKMQAVKLTENNLIIDGNTYFCNICNKPCSGLISYQQHINGASHLKNVKRDEDLKLKSDSVGSVMQPGHNTEINILEKHVSPFVKDSNQQLKSQEMDYILPELAERFQVLSTERLEESIKIFLPDDEIDFDQSEVKMKRINLEENVTNAISEEIQVEAKVNDVKAESEVYQVCDICNVHLMNKIDAASHYESLEHFTKRWRSD